MSRHTIESSETELVAGWDPPTQSYFAQVWDRRDEEAESPIVWISGIEPLPTAASLLEVVDVASSLAEVELPEYDRALLVRALDDDRLNAELAR